MGDEIDQLAVTADRIMHDMPVRPPPGLHLLRKGGVGQRIAVDKAAPADAPGKARFGLSEHTVAHRRMNAVGADHDVRFDFPTVGKSGERDAVPRLRACAGSVGVEQAIGKRRDQQIQQIGTVHGDELCAVFFRDIARPARPRDDTSAAEAADNLLPCLIPGFNGLILDTEIPESLHRVGTEIQPGADFAQFGRLLVERDLVPATVQRQCRRRATEPAADDGNLRHAGQGRGLRLFSRTARS